MQREKKTQINNNIEWVEPFNIRIYRVIWYYIWINVNASTSIYTYYYKSSHYKWVADYESWSGGVCYIYLYIRDTCDNYGNLNFSLAFFFSFALTASLMISFMRRSLRNDSHFSFSRSSLSSSYHTDAIEMDLCIIFLNTKIPSRWVVIVIFFDRIPLDSIRFHKAHSSHSTV